MIYIPKIKKDEGLEVRIDVVVNRQTIHREFQKVYSIEEFKKLVANWEDLAVSRYHLKKANKDNEKVLIIAGGVCGYIYGK